ncbi:MAG: DUF2867 domain-containing protein [Pseudomonadota bacterium]
MTEIFHQPDRAADYSDTFAGPNAHEQLTARELAALALSRVPGWFAAMFALRQRLASLVGLKTAHGDGGQVGTDFLLELPVLIEEPDRFRAGLNDRHLDFAIDVRKRNGEVSITTDIWFGEAGGGLFGRAYLTAVKPFHNAILRHWVRVIATPEVA